MFGIRHRQLRWFNESFLGDLREATRTPSRRLKNVVGYFGIRSGDAIKNDIERTFGIVWITVFAGFDESFSVAYCLAFDEHDHSLFRSWIKELTWHGVLPTTISFLPVSRTVFG